MPANLSRWVIGILVAICGLGALLLASRAEQAIMYYTGVFFFIGSVLVEGEKSVPRIRRPYGSPQGIRVQTASLE